MYVLIFMLGTRYVCYVRVCMLFRFESNIYSITKLVAVEYFADVGTHISSRHSTCESMCALSVPLIQCANYLSVIVCQCVFVFCMDACVLVQR